MKELILLFARETGWGYDRIQGELKKLGITVAANTIKKIMIKNGFHPSPNRTKGDWDRFLKRHMDTLWACDFFTKNVWTAFGKVTYYVLFFIHVETRRVKICGVTVQPDGLWVEQQARNLAMELAELGEKATYLIKDADTKFTEKFDRVFEGEGIKVKRILYRSPNLNAFAERYVQSIKQECLDPSLCLASTIWNIWSGNTNGITIPSARTRGSETGPLEVHHLVQHQLIRPN